MKKKILNIKIETNDNEILINLHEALSFYNVNILYEEIKKIFDAKKIIIFDFKYCVKIDTSVLAFLIHIKDKFKKVEIRNYTDSIKYILSLYDKVSFEYK